MLELEIIERLIQLMEQSSLKTIDIEDGEQKIRMSKLDNPPIVAPGPAPVYPAQFQPPIAPPPGGQDAAPEDVEEELNIQSPIVGTFYSAPGPTLPAYVKVGDTVKAGSTVCIIEAMKMMNEIVAEFDCEISAILVSNEQKVEYGQPLFRVRKLQR